MRCNARKMLISVSLFALWLAGFPAFALRPVDVGDVYIAPSEAGWGLQVADQGDLLFLTFYVYGPDTKPTWFTALASYTSTNAAGARIYTGSVFVNTGPYYGGVFNPANVAARNAGTATFEVDSSTTATLTYTVDNVTVTKGVQRFAFNTMNLSGTGYVGAFIELDSGCANPAKNGPRALNGTFNITHNPPAAQVTLNVTFSDGVNVLACTLQGPFSQAGRYGAIGPGTYACPASGDSGTFNAHDIELTSQGILGRYDTVSSKNGCHATGGFGGLLPS